MGDTTTLRAAAEDQGNWVLEQDETGVTLLAHRRPSAQARVSGGAGPARLEFWLSDDVPTRLRVALARSVFDSGALTARQPVVVALPHGQSEVLDEVRGHLTAVRTRVAGATCLVEGRVR